MKNHPPTRRSGFTLIELLVVISIIAVLAGLAIPTANIVLRKAKETQARAGVQGLVIAVKGYQTEYNRLPSPGAAGGAGGPPPETPIQTDSSTEIVSILLGKNPTYNPREISFYDPPIAKGEANGLISSGGGEGGGSGSYEVVDPWSTSKSRQYYHMALDYDGNHSIANPVKSESSKFNDAFISAEPIEVSADVIVYSENDPRIASGARKPITSW